MLDTRAVVRIRQVGGSASVLPYVALSCGDHELLAWLGEITGVRVVMTRRGYDKHRCLEHCRAAHEHIRSVSERWSVSGARATVLLSATRKWVRFQEAAWERALMVGIGVDRKEATVAKMAQLGWPLPVAWTAL